MSGLSLPHLFLLVLVLVMIFGTSKLKNLGKDLGGAIKGFKESMREEDDKASPPQKLAQNQPPIDSSATPVNTTKKDNV